MLHQETSQVNLGSDRNWLGRTYGAAAQVGQDDQALLRKRCARIVTGERYGDLARDASTSSFTAFRLGPRGPQSNRLSQHLAGLKAVSFLFGIRNRKFIQKIVGAVPFRVSARNRDYRHSRHYRGSRVLSGPRLLCSSHESLRCARGRRVCAGHFRISTSLQVA